MHILKNKFSLGLLKKSYDLIGNRTHDLPARSIVPQPIALPISEKNIQINKQQLGLKPRA
jgi:hypothetical protein